MNNHVGWTIEADVQDGQELAFRELMGELVSATKTNEPGTLSYEWNLSADGQRFHVCERYADSTAAMTHLGTFMARYFDRFFAAVTPTRCVVYGSPSAEVRGVMDGLNPEYLGLAAGFSRF